MFEPVDSASFCALTLFLKAAAKARRMLATTSILFVLRSEKAREGWSGKNGHKEIKGAGRWYCRVLPKDGALVGGAVGYYLKTYHRQMVSVDGAVVSHQNMWHC